MEIKLHAAETGCAYMTFLTQGIQDGNMIMTSREKAENRLET
jgi:hypothetical protein